MPDFEAMPLPAMLHTVFISMNLSAQTFRKEERLCSKKVMMNLFGSGEVFFTPLFKVVWCLNQIETEFPAQVAFSVLKKNYRRAVDRNLIKRRMREAYRKNKYSLYEKLDSLDISIAFIIIFRGAEITSCSNIEKHMKEMLAKLSEAVTRNHQNC